MQPLFASSVYNTATLKAHQEYLKLKVTSGRQLVEQELQVNPTNAAALLIENYGDFLTLCVQQDASAYDALIKRQEDRLYKIEKVKDNGIWKKYAQAEVKMQIGVSKLLFGNKLSAAWDIRQAYLHYTSIAKHHPDFIPNKKTLGMLQVLIGSVPDNYKWFLNIIGMKGSIKAGLANLKAAATKENPFQAEAQIMYGLTLQLVDQEHEQQAIRILESITNRHSDNLLFRFAAIHLLKKTKHSEKALALYTKRPQGIQYLSFPYLQHMAADLYLYRGDFEESANLNLSFLNKHKGKHYLKAAHFKLYLAYFLSDHRPQALWYYNKIADVGLEEIEEDKYAAKYVLKNESPIKPLLLARLQSDGSYYKEALKSLSSLDVSKAALPAQAEYTYRMARVFDGLKDTTQAVKFYKNTISVSGNSNLYFAPNAALQLGYIYRVQNQDTLAKAYFKKAMSYKDHEYKNSIDAKAKLALSSF
ncbi:tetratricopeptide repeat protein [Pontibacter sp. H249]|uniref:tetratricopeptide repeat protein n=1 Tax=Pontibacter sp. H249 TaxID=3133420 RepID=UPI0030C5EA01